MTKKPRSFTLDEDIYHRLKEDNSTNASALVNEFLRQYYEEGRGTDAALLRQRRDELERRIEAKKEEIERLREERDQIDERLNTVEETQEEVVSRAKDVLELEEDRRDPENPAIRNWANKAGMEPGEFLEVYENGE